MTKRIISFVVTAAMVLSLMIANVSEVKAANFNNSIIGTTLYPSGCLESMTLSIKAAGNYATAYGKIAIHSAPSRYGWDNRWTKNGNASWPETVENDNFITWGEGEEFLWTDCQQHIIEVFFNDGDVNLSQNGDFHVYLWTRATAYGIYPDAHIYKLTVSDGQLSDPNGNVIADVKDAPSHDDGDGNNDGGNNDGGNNDGGNNDGGNNDGGNNDGGNNDGGNNDGGNNDGGNNDGGNNDDGNNDDGNNDDGNNDDGNSDNENMEDGSDDEIVEDEEDVCTSNTCVASVYSDFDFYAYYHDAIHYCVENKYLGGYIDGTIRAEEGATRAMIAEMLWRAEGMPASENEMEYTDIKADSWYAEAVRWASEIGIIVGYSDSIFAPHDIVTNEQLATIFMRYAQYKNADISGRGAINVPLYIDGAEVASYAVPAVSWAVTQNMISTKGGYLRPDEECSRADAAQWLMLLMENSIK